MIDRTKGVRQWFEFWRVDPLTWADAEPLRNVSSAKVVRDSTTAVIERATLQMVEQDIGESWVRAYEIIELGQERERTAIGTWLVQTPGRSATATHAESSAEAYSPLHPLMEALAPRGWAAPAGSDPIGLAAEICERHGVAPVVGAGEAVAEPLASTYIPEDNAPWLDVANRLLASGGRYVDFDAMGRILFQSVDRASLLVPTHTFTDDGTSDMIEGGASETVDWFGVPNVVEVAFTVGNREIVARAENDDDTSVTSLQARGREVTHAVKDPPELASAGTQEAADLLARTLLEELSSTERTVQVTHLLDGVRVGDCVLVDYASRGITATGRVVRQEFDLAEGATVTSTITASKLTWRNQI